MMVHIRSFRGISVELEVKPEWRVDELAKAYHELIGARNYKHLFVREPNTVMKGNVPIVHQLKDGKKKSI